MTAAGATALRQELHRLKNEDRGRVIRAIAEARAHGDIKENAEYHAAKDQQGMIEARIRDIESKLACAEVIDPEQLAGGDTVVFGAKVELRRLDDAVACTYQLVGEDEADVTQQRLSVHSPLGQALVGRHSGDIVRVETPGGEVEYQVRQVRCE